MPSGVILVDKPAGITSSGVVYRVRKQLNIKKVGHAGTLDPDATGLLVVLVNQATKLARFLEAGIKTYSGELLLGISTSTDDTSGAVIASSDKVVSIDQLRSAVNQFIGEIEQVPPKVSAVHVAGKRAYDLARQGIDFKLASRTVTVSSFEVAEGRQNNMFSYKITCSKGTYIRSLARDLGEYLGVGGTIASIRREYSSPFSIEQACTLDEVAQDKIIPINQIIPTSKRLVLDDNAARAIMNGQRYALSSLPTCDQEWLAYCSNSNPEAILGILGRVEDTWSILCNFNS